MGLIARVRDIVNSNVGAVLDKAENPEKLAKLLISEIEDVLVEIKGSCATAMATAKQVERDRKRAQTEEQEWARRADLAVDKGRDDLAREALRERRRYAAKVEALTTELDQCNATVDEYKTAIVELESKLRAAREKQRMLVVRHERAVRKQKTERQLRRLDTTDVFARLDRLEHRIEAQTDRPWAGSPSTLAREIDSLADGDAIERELAALKAKHQQPVAAG